jgi:epsilon-lactone hydrolase
MTIRWHLAILAHVPEPAHLIPFPQAPDGIELRHLRAFVAVAEELSFSKAADRLYLSAPALSRQIRGLEQLVGTELLRRSTHGVALTLAGEALLDRARKLLRDVDEAVSATMTVGGQLMSRITKLWEPMIGRLATDADLHEARAIAERLQEQLTPSAAPPAGCEIRAVAAGGVPSLIVAPAGISTPTVLFLHGGAYVLGSAYGYRAHASALGLAARAGVLVPDYRLAPEHPFPAAVEDSLSAYLWLLERGIPADTIAVAGDSSGGGLALSLLQTLKRRDVPLPGAVVLLCPWLDLRLRNHNPDPASSPVTLDDGRNCAALYLAGHSPDDPILDPFSADLHGFPPILIQDASGDPRLADAKALAARARAHGVSVQLALYPVDAHGFQLFWSFLPEAADAIEAAGAFIRQTTRAGAGPMAAADVASPAARSRGSTGNR